MSAFDEKVRGARARQIMGDEVFKEAVQKTQDSLLDDLLNIKPFDPEAPIMALRGVMRIQALSYVMQDFQSIMATGEIAAENDV
jgi:hypothetical protein